MNEFSIIEKYLSPLTKKNDGSLNLKDDIFIQKSKKIAVSIDTFVEGVHFFNSKNPDFFLRKVLRSSLSDLLCKGVLPKHYFLSFAIPKKNISRTWLKKIKNILLSEQKKFNISLSGGDTTSSPNFVITIGVLGIYKFKPILRNGAKFNDDIYVTGNIGDSAIGLDILRRRINFGQFNLFFKNKHYYPDLPLRITPYLYKVANSSIDISDGLAQDLKHICKNSNCGAFIDLNLLPLSSICTRLIKKKQIHIKKIFSKGDDYQILFTSKVKNRVKISHLSKKLKIKISRIGFIKKEKNIVFRYNDRKFKLNAKKMGYIHNF